MAKKEETKDNKGKDGTIKIQYYKSMIGYPEKQKRIVRGLGITKMNQIVEREDTPSMRGIPAKIPHLLRIIK